MTVAPATLTPFAARVQLVRRWELVLIVMGLCLPIPLFAATGLSLPLPATVQRLAAALVPWSNAASLEENQALDGGTRGSIVRAPGETAPEIVPMTSAATNPRPASAAASASRGGTLDAGKNSGESGDGSGSGSGDGDGSGPPPPGPGDPPGPTAPVQGLVDQVDGATQPAIDEVGGTVTGVTDTVNGIVGGLGK
jgi:hypothetical protein